MFAAGPAGHYEASLLLATLPPPTPLSFPRPSCVSTGARRIVVKTNIDFSTNAGMKRSRQSSGCPDKPPAKRRPSCPSHQKITIEISSSPEPDLPSRGNNAPKSVQVEVVTIASSSKYTKPSTSLRGQQSSAIAKSAAAKAASSSSSEIIEISSDEESLPQPKKGARKQGPASGNRKDPARSSRSSGAIQGEDKAGRQGDRPSERRKNGRPTRDEIRREGKGKMRAVQENPSQQHENHTRKVQEEEIGREGTGNKGTEQNPSPVHQTSASDLDHWFYNIRDLDPAQLEALAIVASAEAGVEAGGAGAPPGNKVTPNENHGTSGLPLHLENMAHEGASHIDEDGDTVMIDAPQTPTPVILQDFVEAILNVKPDLDPAYVANLVKTYAPGHGPQTVDVVLEIIFSNASPASGKSDVVEGAKPIDDESSPPEITPHKANQAELVECQCCFDQHASTQTVHCPQGHPFCSPCLRRYAEERVGAQNPDLLCMHQDGCNMPFHVSQLTRALPDEMLSLLQRTHQRQEVKKAKLKGFEECPFCDWGCIMEIPIEQSTVFVCGNEGICGKVSCRLCRKEHGQKQCAEAESERDTRLAIEEAMTKAVIRTCPNCPQVSFVKEEGCNKMVCPECRSFSCYSCKAQISGYEHFYPNDLLSICVLFDEFDIHERHANEVNNAFQEAVGLHP